MKSSGPVLVVLAAGSARRFGGLKQLEAVGPHGQALLDYTILDWAQSGGERVVLVVGNGMESAFRDHISAVHRSIEPVVHIATQSLPPGRSRPWGTADAVARACDFVPGACVVANADDFYGKSSLRLVLDILAARTATGQTQAAADCVAVGYPVGQTLSDRGGVSRALLGEGAGVEELVDVQRTPAGVTGLGTGRGRVALADTDMVSMNLWGFSETFLDRLRDDVESFREENVRSPEAEYGLSTAVADQLARGTAELTVIRARDAWFGMTYADDVEGVRARLRDLTDRGVYPERF